MDFKSAWFLPALFLVACSGSDNVAKIWDRELSSEAFQAHLSFKRIDPDNTQQVEAELNRYLEQTALAQAVASTDLFDAPTVNAEVEAFRTQMMVSRYMADYLEKAVTQAAVENYYNANSENYTQQQAHVAHIVFRIHNAMTDAEKQAAAQKARDTVAKLARGESFEALANSESDDVYSAENGGDLGWINVESVDPDFAKAALALEPGQTSEVVQSQYGYHIVKLLEPIKKQVAPLEQVEGDIRYILRQKAKQAETERLLGTVDVVRSE